MEIRKYFEPNDTYHRVYQNLWDSTTAGLGGKFIALNTKLKKNTKLEKGLKIKHQSYLTL